MKTVWAHAHVGSNPTLSAKNIAFTLRWELCFFVGSGFEPEGFLVAHWGTYGYAYCVSPNLSSRGKYLF